MPKTRKKISLSLRIRVFIIMILVALVPTILVSVMLINSTKNSRIEEAFSDIKSQTKILAGKLQDGDYFSNVKESKLNEAIDEMSNILCARIEIANKDGKVVYDTAGADIDKFNTSKFIISAISNDASSDMDNSEMKAIVSEPIISNKETELNTKVDKISENQDPQYQAKILGAVLVVADMNAQVATFDNTQSQMFLIIAAAVIAVIFASFLITLFLFKPFKRLQRNINDAADGNVSKVSVRDYAEIARISDSVNTILHKIKVLEETKQDFVSNVSHELKTPITSMRVLADSINSMGEVPNDMYKEFMHDISKELEREGNIIDDLLSMSRLEESEAPLNLSEVNLNEWLEQTLNRLGPIAKAANVEILLESFRPVTANIDETKLTLAISNLVENSIKYNKEEGFVKVSLNSDHHYFFIKVEDSGIGIPDDAMPHLFERFFRVDKDRARETGGTGLGLAITKMIVNLHNGSIKAYSEYGVGTTFAIRIPLNYKDKEDANEKITM